MISVKVEGLDEAVISIQGIKKALLSRAIMGRIAAQVSTDVKARTKEGKDVKGRKFAPYSPMYMIRKKARGGKFFKAGVVNLDDSGAMQAAIQWQVVNSRTARIIFVDTEQALKAQGHQSGNRKRGLPQRQFFGVGDREGRSINKILYAHLKRVTSG